MRRFAVVMGCSAGLLLLAASADAQWQYTDGKGVSKVAQYKLKIPAQHRDAAVWVGPTGVGKPGLSKAMDERTQRDKEYERIGRSLEENLKHGRAMDKAEQQESAVRQRYIQSEAQRQIESLCAAQPLSPQGQAYETAQGADVYKNVNPR